MNEKKQTLEYIINPHEKICLLLYTKEQNAKYIANILSKKYKDTNVTDWLADLTKSKMIIVKPNPDDGRKCDYIAHPRCFFQGSKNKFLGIELTDDETKSITIFLHSKVFRDAFIRIINTNLSKNELPDFSLIKELLCFYSIYVISLEEFIAYKKGEFGKEVDIKIQLPGYADINEDTYLLDEEVVKNYLLVTMKSIFGFEDEFLLNFLKLDRSLRQKLANLLSPLKMQMLLTFFLSIASVVDTFDNNLCTKN